jgi:hypothetical protein
MIRLEPVFARASLEQCDLHISKKVTGLRSADSYTYELMSYVRVVGFLLLDANCKVS